MRRRFKLKNACFSIILYNADYSSELFQRDKTIFVCSDFVKDAHERLKIMNKVCKVKFRSSHRWCSEKVFLEISQNSQENNGAKVSLPEACNFI